MASNAPCRAMPTTTVVDRHFGGTTAAVKRKGPDRGPFINCTPLGDLPLQALVRAGVAAGSGRSDGCLES